MVLCPFAVSAAAAAARDAAVHDYAAVIGADASKFSWKLLNACDNAYLASGYADIQLHDQIEDQRSQIRVQCSSDVGYPVPRHTTLSLSVALPPSVADELSLESHHRLCEIDESCCCFAVMHQGMLLVKPMIWELVTPLIGSEDRAAARLTCKDLAAAVDADSSTAAQSIRVSCWDRKLLHTPRSLQHSIRKLEANINSAQDWRQMQRFLQQLPQLQSLTCTGEHQVAFGRPCNAQHDGLSGSTDQAAW